MKTPRQFLLSLALAFTTALPALAGEATAFDLIKLGNQYVGVQSKDKVVQLRSEKSIATLTPNIWHVVYYDPDTTFKSTAVKFGAGQKLDVSRPWRVLELGKDDHGIMDRSKMKVDSDKALKTAAAEPLLKNLTLKAAQLTLERNEAELQWKVKLWAAKLKHPNEDADIGVVFISATDGKVIKTDLHPNSVD